MCVELVGRTLPQILDGAIDMEQLLVAGGGTVSIWNKNPNEGHTGALCV